MFPATTQPTVAVRVLLILNVALYLPRIALFAFIQGFGNLYTLELRRQMHGKHRKHLTSIIFKFKTTFSAILLIDSNMISSLKWAGLVRQSG